MSKNIVVTGSSGFVGKILVKKLSLLGYHVVALDLVDPCIDNVNYIKCDIGNNFDYSKFEIPKESIFVHLAAVSTDTQCKENPLLAMTVNLLGTQRVVDLAKHNSASHFIFASSEWVYPESENSHTQQESEKLHLSDLNSLYAMTKLMAENLIRIEKSTPTTILRFGIVYGPRSLPGSSAESIALKVAYGENIELGSAQTARRFIFVDDLVSAILKCVNKNPVDTYSIYNVSGPALITLGNIAETVKKISGSNSIVMDKGLNPSIRNPDPSHFEDTFGKIAETSLEEGLGRCLSVMKYNQE